MRILGFQREWAKLEQFEFTTFRYPRRDKDWIINESVQIVIKPRSKERQFCGIARIVNITTHYPNEITNEMAREDGFINADDMKNWLAKTYGNDDRWVFNEPIHCLILLWVNGYDNNTKD